MRAIIMRTNGTIEVTQIEKGTATLDQIVEGSAEGVTFTGHTDMVMFLNEMGKYEELPINSRASLLFMEYEDTFGLLEGNAVLCGLDENGDTCDLSREQIEEVIHIILGGTCEESSDD